MAIVAMLCSLVLIPGTVSCFAAENDYLLSNQQIQNDYSGISVTTSDMEDGVTGVIGKIHINASPKHVWAAITDYENQKNFVPKLIDSGLISDNGNEQIMFEKGKTGILFFRKTVYIKLSIRSDYLQRLSFRQIEGDFKVYEGDWLIGSSPDGKGTMLTFRAKIKPAFFAPPMFVRKVQQQDLPMVLEAMKKRAESAAASLNLPVASSAKNTTSNEGTAAIAD
jgi:ribosome-associated toxin RatA of RatAB toxin-antitoxin module